MRILSGLLLAAAAFAGADQPQLSISNGLVEMKLFPPDPQQGYYQGTRFDWSGQVASLRYQGHDWFGQWNASYDPKLHDAIMGPVEDFRTNGAGLGFDEAKPCAVGAKILDRAHDGVVELRVVGGEIGRASCRERV